MTDGDHRTDGARRRPQATRRPILAVPIGLSALLVAAPLLLLVGRSAPGGRVVAGEGTASPVSRPTPHYASRSQATVLTAAQLAALASGASADVSGVTAPSAPPRASRARPGSTTTTSPAAPAAAPQVMVAVASTGGGDAGPPRPVHPLTPLVTTTTSTTAPPTTTTTSPPTTTTTTQPRPAPPAHSETGSASWYYAPAGTCANRTLAFGTVVTVTNLANGATTRCRVEDRGPFEGGRIIDLSEASFSEIASTSDGVIQVRIAW